MRETTHETYSSSSSPRRPSFPSILFASAFYDVRGDTQYVDYSNTLALTGATRIRVGAVSGLTLSGTHGSGLREGATPVWTVTASLRERPPVLVAVAVIV